MVINVKTRDLLRDFNIYTKKLESGEVDKILVEGLKDSKLLEIKLVIKGKSPAQQALEYCRNLKKPLNIKPVSINIFDNFIK